MRQATIKLAVNSELETQATHSECLSEFLHAMKVTKTSSLVKVSHTPVEKDVKTFFSVPFAVNYTGKSYLGVPYTHPDGPALQVTIVLS